MNGIERMKAETSIYLDVLGPGATGLGACSGIVSLVKSTQTGFWRTIEAILDFWLGSKQAHDTISLKILVRQKSCSAFQLPSACKPKSAFSPDVETGTRLPLTI
jgi:hypothetical protein